MIFQKKNGFTKLENRENLETENLVPRICSCSLQVSNKTVQQNWRSSFVDHSVASANKLVVDGFCCLVLY